MNVVPLSVAVCFRRLALLSVGLVVAGCQTTPRVTAPVVETPPPPVIQAPLATHQFPLSEDDAVVGELQVTKVEGEDTFSDIARRFNLGYEELVRANPGIDPWLPGEGREIVLPTQYVLPSAPREGLVINVAQLRVFYFPKAAEGEQATVITHPIGIGKVGWSTPEGTTKVTGKQKNPVWTPPASVRKEHREAGDPLPARVPPGPDNPLGAYKMTLGWPSYLIHGTNKPYGVGMRSSHGCIRFYPEDIEQLFGEIPVGTKVTVVNQPLVLGWHRDAMYLQAFPVLEDDTREHPSGADAVLKAGITDEMWQRAKAHNSVVDLALVDALVAKPRGIALPVSKRGVTLEKYLYASRHVENRLPEGANWNGKEELLVSTEQFEAARNGVILPGESAKKKMPTPKKPANPKTTAVKSISAAPTAKANKPVKAVPVTEASAKVAPTKPTAAKAAGSTVETATVKAPIGNASTGAATAGAR
jgi:L,D-transpeptidase ErfK/SrfK